MAQTVLTKKIVLDYLKNHKLMIIATYGAFPWIASVYYSYDDHLNLYFLSSPETLHVKHIVVNKKVAVAIVDSHQKVTDMKRGLQISGVANQISGANKIKHALRLWKDALNITNPKYTYEGMMKKLIKGRMYMIKPLKIKLFDQELFKVEDGHEPMMSL